VISGDALTDIDLTRMREFHGSHDGLATLATKRVQDTSQFGVAITGSDGRIQGFQEKPDPAEALSNLANCGIYMFDAEIFDFFPAEGETSKAAEPDDPPGFADWAMDVFPALLDGDVPFYSHEIGEYWNDIGNLEELREGNFAALTGAVGVDAGVPEVAEGVRAGEGSELSGAEVVAPALFGDRVEVGEGTIVTGPAVIGDECRIGPGSRLRDVVVLPGTELPEGFTAAGGIVAGRTVDAS
jgi:mannose-1-phosphate guanylyltransferase/mannose-1-phosphate guanylyltransferase/phosphomannomutase